MAVFLRRTWISICCSRSGCLTPAEARAPYFDATRSAWVLSRYAHVHAALGDARLAVFGAPAAPATELPPRRTAPWSPAMQELARQDADRRLHAAAETRDHDPTHPVDLLHTVIRPWCATLAQAYARLDDDTMARAVPLADAVFHHAAIATCGVPHPASLAAVGALAQTLGVGPDEQQRALRVQAYVALVASLPCLMAGVWHALLLQPAQLAALRDAADVPGALAHALPDLLRAGSPTRAVFREARVACAYGDARIAAGDDVILLLHAADHDRDGLYDTHRHPPLTFGAGDHRCVGAAIAQRAVALLTARWLAVLAQHPMACHPAHPVSWHPGFALRGLATLPVLRGATTT